VKALGWVEWKAEFVQGIWGRRVGYQVVVLVLWVRMVEQVVHLQTLSQKKKMRRRGSVRADLGGHLKYSRRWSGVRAGVLLGAQGAVRRGENRGEL